MNVKERIAAIRLLEKMERLGEHGEKLGIKDTSRFSGKNINNRPGQCSRG